MRKMGMSEDYEGCVTPIRSDISPFSRGTDGAAAGEEPALDAARSPSTAAKTSQIPKLLRLRLDRDSATHVVLTGQYPSRSL